MTTTSDVPNAAAAYSTLPTSVGATTLPATNELGHLRTREVGQVLEHAVGRMLRTLRRHGHLEIEHDVEEDGEPEAALCASAVSGREPRHTSSPRNGSAGSRRLLRARSRTTSRCALRSKTFDAYRDRVEAA